MVLNRIEKLIEKYENGETTLQEEQQLKRYFSQETVPPHLQVYKTMFQYFSLTQSEQYAKDIPLKPKKTINLYKWISVAAIAIIMLGVYVSNYNKPRTFGTLSDEELLVYNQTKEALNILSSNFNKGKENMFALELMSDSFEKATKNMAYLNEFSKTTNKIFNNKQNTRK